MNYHSKRLAEHFQKYGQQSVEVSIDPENMGHISVWLERGKYSGWSTLGARIEGLEADNLLRHIVRKEAGLGL
ncbi:Mu transposase C-terminal domain-containing protein [Ruegeria arenilitoris]|uniref:Mu transposase C-terminal domain-containing protein n=1 Tax=Ruegeria arenilitoris TaxID=1173585 RepID=UPI003C7B1818